MRQRVPSHRSARVLAPGVKALAAPTAVHADGEVQATEARSPPPCGGLAVAWMLQRVPSHRSARVPALENPTAVHADAEVHATPLRKPLPCGGLGVAWMLQRVPSHRSARAWEAPAVVTLIPTAMHADDAVHATPKRSLTAVPGGLGVGRMRHEVPFHRSASATPAPETLVYPPTAMHELAVEQDTQKSRPVGITGFGLGVTDQ